MSQSLTNSPLAAEIKLGPERVGARTDGGLQIFLPRNDKTSIAWDRSYYEVALEAKRFFKSQSKDGVEHISEVTGDSIHSGQIFAEMLGAVCHPEFFEHSDVEVSSLCPMFLNGIDSRHTSYISNIRPSNYSTPSFRKPISANRTVTANLAPRRVSIFIRRKRMISARSMSVGNGLIYLSR